MRKGRNRVWGLHPFRSSFFPSHNPLWLLEILIIPTRELAAFLQQHLCKPNGNGLISPVIPTMGISEHAIKELFYFVPSLETGSDLGNLVSRLAQTVEERQRCVLFSQHPMGGKFVFYLTSGLSQGPESLPS